MTQKSGFRTCRFWIIGGLFTLCRFSCFGAAVLEWDANPEPNVAGYNVYIGSASRTYTQVIDVGAQTRFELTNLNAGVTYFLAVTAYDTERLESPFSDEVGYTPPIDGVNAITIAAHFRITTNVLIQFTAVAGQRCWIAASRDLRVWEQVHSVEMPLGGVVNGVVKYLDAAPATQPMRFYRIIGTPP